MTTPREVTVNAFERVLWPLSGLGDDDDSELHDIDSTDEAQLRAMFRTFLRPEFDSIQNHVRFAVKLSMAYFLTTTRDDTAFARPLDAILASELNTPEPKDFYLWLWDELFSGERWELPEIERYRVSKRGVLMRDKKPILTPEGD